MPNAHALHGVPPVAVSSSASPVANQPPAGANQVKDDALNHAESKIDEEKLQVCNFVSFDQDFECSICAVESSGHAHRDWLILILST